MSRKKTVWQITVVGWTMAEVGEELVRKTAVENLSQAFLPETFSIADIQHLTPKKISEPGSRPAKIPLPAPHDARD